MSDARIDQIVADVATVRADVAALVATSEQREINISKFWETEWPLLATRLDNLEDRVRSVERDAVTISGMKASLEGLVSRVESIERKIYIAVGALAIVMPVINQLVSAAAKGL